MMAAMPCFARSRAFIGNNKSGNRSAIVTVFMRSFNRTFRVIAVQPLEDILPPSVENHYYDRTMK